MIPKYQPYLMKLSIITVKLTDFCYFSPLLLDIFGSRLASWWQMVAFYEPFFCTCQSRYHHVRLLQLQWQSKKIRSGNMKNSMEKTFDNSRQKLSSFSWAKTSEIWLHIRELKISQCGISYEIPEEVFILWKRLS